MAIIEAIIHPSHILDCFKRRKDELYHHQHEPTSNLSRMREIVYVRPLIPSYSSLHYLRTIVVHLTLHMMIAPKTKMHNLGESVTIVSVRPRALVLLPEQERTRYWTPVPSLSHSIPSEGRTVSFLSHQQVTSLRHMQSLLSHWSHRSRAR